MITNNEKHGSKYLCQETCLHRLICRCLDTRVLFKCTQEVSQTICPCTHNIFSIKIHLRESPALLSLFLFCHIHCRPQKFMRISVWLFLILLMNSHKQTVRVINSLNLHIFITSSASKNFRANHRLYFLCFCFVIYLLSATKVYASVCMVILNCTQDFSQTNCPCR